MLAASKPSNFLASASLESACGLGLDAARFAPALLNARLWLSSWFARNRLAVTKPPKAYAVSSSTGHDALFPSHQATASWRLTTAKICGQVVQSGPYRSLICGYFSRISLLRFA